MNAPRTICIALSSTAMGSGKSTIAEHLVHKHGFALVKMAGPLKAMTRELFRSLGMDAEEIERRVEGDLKEVEIDSIQSSTRHIMQTLGTEWGRHCIGEDFWVSVALSRIKEHMNNGVSVVVDDMRFLNEWGMLNGQGAFCYRVNRPSAVVTSTHASEGELDNIHMAEICNRRSIPRLLEKVDALLHGL